MANNLPPGFEVEGAPAQTSGSGALPPGFEPEASDSFGPAKAGVAGAARMLTFGGSDAALTKTGLVQPETLKTLEDENPVSTFAGEGAGLALAHLYGVGEAEDAIAASKAALKAAQATGNAAEIAEATKAFSTIKNTMGAGDILNPVKAVAKLGGKASEAVGGGILGHVAAGAAEGGLFGVQQTASEASLGDPSEAAEHLLHNVGYGTLIGAGLGTAAGGFGAILKRAPKNLPEAVIAAGDSLESANNKVDQIIGDTPRETAPLLAPETSRGVQPTSLEDLAEKQAQAVSDGKTRELPQKAAFDQAVSRLDLENPIHPMQADALSSQESLNHYEMAKEIPGEHGSILRNNEAIQKAELLDKTDGTIQNLSPSSEVTSNAVEGGERAADTFTDIIQKNRAELGPKIAEMKAIEGKEFHVPGVIDALTNPDMPHGNSNLSKMFDTSGKDVKFKPWDSTMGIEKKTYSNVKQAIKDVQKDPTNFSNLFNIRKAIDSGVNLMDSGTASTELGKAKAGMMDYIQGVIQKSAPNEDVRGWFRKYAINEENAKIIEKKFGAEIGTDNFKSIAKNKPQENILNNIFRNSSSVKAAKAILPPEKFEEMLANHLAEQRERVTQDNVFSSKKFNTYLRGNQDALNEAFADKPMELQKLKDLNTVMRFFPDATSANPSHSARTLWSIFDAHGIGSLLKNLKEFGAEKYQQQQQISEINQKLAGLADKSSRIEKISSIAEKTSKQISSGADSILSDSKGVVGFTAQKLTPEEYKNKTKQISALANDANNLQDKITQVTSEIYKHAPNVTAALQQNIVNTTNFLNSKLPPKMALGPFVNEVEPTPEEISKFNRYYSVVQDPTSVLAQVKNMTLTNEAVETMQALYPKMYSQMKTAIMDKVTKMKDPASLSYKTKSVLSQFLGEPIHPSLTPQAIASNQAVYAQQDQPQQQALKQPKSSQTGMAKLGVAKRVSLVPQDNDQV